MPWIFQIFIPNMQKKITFYYFDLARTSVKSLLMKSAPASAPKISDLLPIGRGENMRHKSLKNAPAGAPMKSGFSTQKSVAHVNDFEFQQKHCIVNQL